MSLLTEIISAEQVDDLYASGFAVIKRQADPFEIPAALIKPDWSYQWFTDGEHPKGWKAVAYQDHPGWFAPPDKQGLVVVRGNRLFRRLKSEVEEFHRQNRKKAEKLLEDWAEEHGAFFGGASVLRTDGEEAIRTMVTAGKGVETKVEAFERPATKTVELVTKIPKDMLEHIDAIFTERDRLQSEIFTEDDNDGRPFFRYPVPDQHREMVEKFWRAIEQDRGAPWWPTLLATILPYAIENVRQKLKETAS